MQANLKDGLLYLSDLAKRNLTTDLVEHTDNKSFGRHDLTRRFTRGLFNLNPPKPRYSLWTLE